MKLKVEVIELDKDDVINILSGFTSYFSYWCTNLDWNNIEYDLAKQALIKQDPENAEDICREDIWAYMLMNMNTCLLLTDDEDERHTLTLEKLFKGITMSMQNNNTSLDPDNWDASDNDMMIQNAIFGDVIYG